MVENITSRKSRYTFYLRGYPDARISGVKVAHCQFNNVTGPDVIENVAGVQLTDVTRNGEPMRQ